MTQSRKDLKEARKQCQKDQSEFHEKEITTCIECPIYDGCCDYGYEIHRELVEAHRQPNGRFGKFAY